MRFFLDNDVPVSVGAMLRQHGHQCWTAAEAGLAAEGEDDNLSVYADEHRAVLVTLDGEFTVRRRKHPIGRHVRLRCPEPRASGLLEARLTGVLEYLERDHVTVTVSFTQIRADSAWGQGS